jgi:hypothetical protein
MMSTASTPEELNGNTGISSLASKGPKRCFEYDGSLSSRDGQIVSSNDDANTPHRPEFTSSPGKRQKGKEKTTQNLVIYLLQSILGELLSFLKMRLTSHVGTLLLPL